MYDDELPAGIPLRPPLVMATVVPPILPEEHRILLQDPTKPLTYLRKVLSMARPLYRLRMTGASSVLPHSGLSPVQHANDSLFTPTLVHLFLLVSCLFVSHSNAPQ